MTKKTSRVRINLTGKKPPATMPTSENPPKVSRVRINLTGKKK